MKKLSILLIIPCLLAPISNVYAMTTTNEDVVLSSSITNNLITKLKGSVELNTNIIFHYNSYLPKINIIDQFDSDNRVNFIFGNDILLQESYITKDSNGYAVESYLSISNTVKTRNITDANENKINFNSTYSSPFSSLVKLSNEKINSYFAVSQINNDYLLKPTSLGYGTISNQLLTFFYDYDNLVWDSSMTRSIDNLSLLIDKDGNPKELVFDKIKKDIFGGVRETYNIDITILEEVNKLSSRTSELTSEQKNDFNSKMSAFQALINEGNFTHNISIAPKGTQDGYFYANYYALQQSDDSKAFIPAMISSCPLEDSTYGQTFISIFETYDGYATYGLSVDADYSSAITEINSVSINSVIPNLDLLSVDFFTYEESSNLYVFDFDNFVYGDANFCDQLLFSLFGVGDPAYANLGLYVSNYNFSFNSLTIGFDENDYPYGYLSFNDEELEIISEFSFSKVGTTDLLLEEDVKKAVDYVMFKGGLI